MTLTRALYLTELLDNFNQSLSIIFVLGVLILIGSGIGFLMCLDSWNDTDAIYKPIWMNILKKWWILLLILFVSIPVPSKKTMYLILGASYLQETNLPSKVSKVLELKLDKYIAELQEDKNE